jgi:hypothetical protein
VTYGCESWTMEKEEDLRGKLSEEFTAQSDKGENGG